MARNIPATILGVMAGAAVSMASGGLLGVYVVTGAAPAYAAEPPRIRPDPPLVDEDTWPAADALGPVQGYGRDTPDQVSGVRASGSSRL